MVFGYTFMEFNDLLVCSRRSPFVFFVVICIRGNKTMCWSTVMGFKYLFVYIHEMLFSFWITSMEFNECLVCIHGTICP